jgi:hypothetical protein
MSITKVLNREDNETLLLEVLRQISLPEPQDLNSLRKRES